MEHGKALLPGEGVRYENQALQARAVARCPVVLGPGSGFGPSPRIEPLRWSPRVVPSQVRSGHALLHLGSAVRLRRHLFLGPTSGARRRTAPSVDQSLLREGRQGRSLGRRLELHRRILASASDLCLVLNSSVNSYRRLDPHFEAPNQIKASAIDRGSMVRIPLGNERSARVEVRSIAPDSNPYMAIYTLLKTGLEGPQNEEDGDKRPRTRFLPDNIYDAIRMFKGSRFMQEAMGEEVHAKFAELKLAQAERCPKALGTLIKASEVQFHHEVTNQFLWSQF